MTITHTDPRLSMTEAALEEEVRTICAQLGVYRYHPYDSRKSQHGWPDDVLVGPWGILYRELKTQTGKVRPEQEDVIARLRRAGADVDVWRPSDWISGRISREVFAISHLARHHRKDDSAHR